MLRGLSSAQVLCASYTKRQRPHVARGLVLHPLWSHFPRILLGLLGFLPRWCAACAVASRPIPHIEPEESGWLSGVELVRSYRVYTDCQYTTRPS